MSKFKIGDRVKYIGQIPELKGKVGTIVSLKTLGRYGVVFDEYSRYFHSLGGLCPFGYGRWCNILDLELISEHRFNVIITSVGDTTTAKLLHGKKVEKEVSVKRYYRDDYSEEAAALAVCKKLFGEDKPKEDTEPMGINCKAVYIGESQSGFTRGKIYEFSDGRCISDFEDWYPAPIAPKITQFDDSRFKMFVKLVDEDEQYGRYTF